MTVLLYIFTWLRILYIFLILYIYYYTTIYLWVYYYIFVTIAHIYIFMTILNIYNYTIHSLDPIYTYMNRRYPSKRDHPVCIVCTHSEYIHLCAYWVYTFVCVFYHSGVEICKKWWFCGTCGGHLGRTHTRSCAYEHTYIHIHAHIHTYIGV